MKTLTGIIVKLWSKRLKPANKFLTQFCVQLKIIHDLQ